MEGETELVLAGLVVKTFPLSGHLTLATCHTNLGSCLCVATTKDVALFLLCHSGLGLHRGPDLCRPHHSLLPSFRPLDMQPCDAWLLRTLHVSVKRLGSVC